MKVAVIGGGAAGMMAAYTAAEGNEVTLFERNEKLGKKLYITGKGRCNVTNDCDAEDFFKNVVTNPKFLYSCVHAFSPEDLKKLIEGAGVPLKTERGNRVFPVSDKSMDIIRCFERLLSSRSVKVELGARVTSVLAQDGKVKGITTEKGAFDFDAVIVCTGGLSYPATGSTGDGYLFAEQTGHKVTKRFPALTGIELEGKDFADAQGLTLKNVSVRIADEGRGGKTIFSDFGELLFTHFGVSGPTILSASSHINKLDPKNLILYIDLKPALDRQTLDARILRDFSEEKNKDFRNALSGLLPKSLIPLVVKRSDIPPFAKVNEVTAPQRAKLATALKELKFQIKGLRGFEESIVTSGGVDVKQIDPKTMESKSVKGLYFAGEVLDVDALTGGFNLQIAFSTGRAAGYYCGGNK